jgi:uncharacterized protein
LFLFFGKRNMRILVTGGTGLVGRRLLHLLRESGFDVVALSRQAQPTLPDGCTAIAGDPTEAGEWLDQINRCDGVVHLAGENVFARRWSRRFKQRIHDSRVVSTRLIAERLSTRPRRDDGSAKFFVVASAIGYYGPHGSEDLDEDSPSASDFLATVCADWESAAEPARTAGVRVTHLRIGLVLDESGGALPKLAQPFRWFVGGPVGNGKQWVSWIHAADLAGLILFAVICPDATGPINATAPEPLTNWGFCKMLGKVLHRPSWLRMPGFLLRILLGEVAYVVVSGQRVSSQRAVKLGYVFQFDDLEIALRDLLRKPPHSSGGAE